MSVFGVLGTGTMGPQIAVAVSLAGHDVRLYNHVNHQETIHKIKLYAKFFAKKMAQSPDDMEAVLGRIRLVSDLLELADAHFVIEAVIEDLSVKQEIFRSLGSICSSAGVLATNTSSLEVEAIGKFAKDPSKVLGLHFFNPVFDIELVEIITTAQTSAPAVEEATAFSRQLNKGPLTFHESCVNRVLIPMINEECLILEQGLAGADVIDQALRLGAKHPIGPLALADLIGIDVVVSILESYEAKRGSRYRPASLLYTMTKNGHLGRKTGRGFFNYGKVKTKL